MRHAAHGATKSKGRNDSPLSLFVAKRGAHGAHGAHGVRAVSQSNAQIDAQNSLAGERLAAISASNGAVVEIPEAVSQRLQELIPQTRRELRLSRLANDRRRRLVFSASLVAMVGAVATTMSLAKVNSLDSRAAEVANAMSTVDDSNVEVSRSTQREPLNSMAVIDNAVNELENDVHAGSAKANAYGDAVNQPGTASRDLGFARC